MELNSSKIWATLKQNVIVITPEDDNILRIDENKFKVVLETTIQPLSDFQRLIFLIITIVVVTLAVVGNVLVLYVNLSRFVQAYIN